MLRIIVIFSIAVVVRSTALAGAGDDREHVRYGTLRQSLQLRCPRGSQLVVSGTATGLEETCVTPEGVRHGYYLRWFEDGETWAMVGRYAHGKPIGRWLRFDATGRRIATSR